MKLSRYRPHAIGLLLLAALTLGSTAGATPTSAPLATAGDFAVLAGAGITNGGTTTISGDIGSFATATITGTATMALTGTNHWGDPTTEQAKTDLGTAYDNTEALTPTSQIVADLGGQTLTPGVYNAGASIGLGGVLTLDAAGDPNAVFVFQAGSTLITDVGSSIDLIRGARACNVYWQVGSSATLGTDSGFVGTVLALASITVNSGVTIDGRVLARGGAVTLIADTITKPVCLPTAVATRSFTAQHAKNGVSLKWRTASEVNVLGFSVYRQHGTKRVKLNPALITGTVTGTLADHGYLFVDHSTTQANASRYWLQVVHLDGSRSWFGPARAPVSS
jgi:Ice-binding-like